jgi:DNA polymerase III subunit delta'
MTPFTPLIGQPQAVELLTQAIAQNRVPPAYLFAGPMGVGRSLAARCFAEMLFCHGVPAAKYPQIQHRLQQHNHPDLLWVEPTYLHQGKRLTVREVEAAGIQKKGTLQVRIEQVREIAQFLSRPPLEVERSLVVIEDADTMAEPAANCLLKTLEEPGQATLILIAKGVETLLPTLVSRCHKIPFYRLPSAEMMQILEQAEQAEILNHPEVLELAQGSPGAAIAAYRQLQAMPPDVLQMIAKLPRSSREALELARQINSNLDKETQLWLVDYLQHRYWQQAHLSTSIQLLEKARQYLLGNAQPRLVWEVTLMQMVV